MNGGTLGNSDNRMIATSPPQYNVIIEGEFIALLEANMTASIDLNITVYDKFAAVSDNDFRICTNKVDIRTCLNDEFTAVFDNELRILFDSQIATT